VVYDYIVYILCYILAYIQHNVDVSQNTESFEVLTLYHYLTLRQVCLASTSTTHRLHQAWMQPDNSTTQHMRKLA